MPCLVPCQCVSCLVSWKTLDSSCVSNERKPKTGVYASPLTDELQSHEIAMMHKAQTGRSYRWMQLQLSHKVLDLKSHTIYGESPQKQDFRMLAHSAWWMSDKPSMRFNSEQETETLKYPQVIEQEDSPWLPSEVSRKFAIVMCNDD